MSKAQKKTGYKATKSFKSIMTDKGLLSQTQYKALTQGQSDELKGVPQKQMSYLLANNLIQEV